MKKLSEISQIFEAHNWVLSTKQLLAHKIYPYQIKKMIHSGEIYKLKYGWYKFEHIKAESPEHEYYEICKMIPKGVFSLLSAAFYYQLTTFIPSAHQISIPRKSTPPRFNYPPVDYFYWDSNPYELGKELIYTNEQNFFYIYNIEKTVCDLIKYRNQIGMEVCKEVLKAYLNKKNRNLDLLTEYAKKLRISKTLNSYLTILL